MICSKNKCTGCFACFNICPKKAISMIKDKYGNIYPKIDANKCINCGLCKKVCPQLKENLDFKEPIDAYAMHIVNEKKRSESTSGGAATVFYEKILNEKGIVYGAANLFGKEQFEFIRITKISDLYKVKGSKYVHCYINNIFSKIKKDLNNDKKVLFIGTPCQISGLNSFLMKEYANLITIDIVCHGVSSQKLLFEEIRNYKINPKNVYYIFFRDEKYFNLKLFDKDKNILLEKKSDMSNYYSNFLQGNIYRENCYNCRYAQRKRISDITIGDFWGLSKESKVNDGEEKGISLIMTNTKKGEGLVSSIYDKCIIEKRTIEEACAINHQLNHPTYKTKKYEIYINNYPKLGYIKTMNKMKTFKEKVKFIIKNNKIIYNIIQKLKHHN